MISQKRRYVFDKPHLEKIFINIFFYLLRHNRIGIRFNKCKDYLLPSCIPAFLRKFLIFSITSSISLNAMIHLSIIIFYNKISLFVKHNFTEKHSTFEPMPKSIKTTEGTEKIFIVWNTERKAYR